MEHGQSDHLPPAHPSRQVARVGGLTVVLPAFNEELNIGPMVDACLSVLPQIADEFEVIVVDDGSTDETAAVARGLVDRDPARVRLLVHDRNRGYGAALRTGFQHATKELVFYTDSDRQFDVAELAYFLPMLADNDLVIGFRVYRYDRFFRTFVSWGYNRLVRVLFRVHARDVDCAFKLMRSEVIAKLPLQTDDFFIDTEIVASARKWNFRISEKGVRHYPRVAGETTVSASDVTRTLATIARMWRRIYLPSAQQRAEADAVNRRIVASEYEPAAGAATGS